MVAPIARRKILALVLMALAAIVGPRAGRGQQSLSRFETAPLSIHSGSHDHRFSVEVARTPRQQAQGLMFRRRLGADAGMLFVYVSQEITSMWMKNTLIPLDMLFIDRAGRIVHIVERTIPRSTATISSRRPAAAVLELNAGTVSRLGIKPGDRVHSPVFGNK